MRHAIAVRIAVVVLWLNLPGFLLAQVNDLNLKHGTYVQASVSCKEPPFAAVQAWDGAGVFGPHTSGCTSRVLSQHNNHFRIITSCSAVGDGTPNPSGEIYSETISLVRLSKDRFVESSKAKPARTFRWCSADTGLGNGKGGRP
jgi:hypothetical protein